jgi:hypothetical protein
VNVRRLTSSLLCALLLATGFEAIIAPAAKASIVSSGLIMNFDAGSSSSYSGSGTTWNDISGNNYNATLTSTSYSASNGGYIGFNGTSSYGTLGTLPNTLNFSAGFTATFFANFGAANSWERIIDFGNGQQSDNIVLARNGTTRSLYLELFNGATSLGSCQAANSILDSTWAWYSMSVDGSSCSIYVNGISQTITTTFSGNTFPIVPKTVARTSNFIGKSNWTGDSLFESGIGKLAIYNRGLSATELYKNYANQYPACPETPTYVGNTGYIALQTRGYCAWTVPNGTNTFNYLIVGGGGGGGGGYNASWYVGGGGGGGGEVLSSTTTFTSGTVQPVLIGGGGSGGAGGTTPDTGTAGETTTVFSISVSARPGLPGIGGKNSSNCGDSGKGGNSGNGNAGKVGECEGGGSGAGSSAVGADSHDIGGQGACGGQGGAGTTSSITGTSIPYGAGGGAGGASSVATTTNANCPRGGTGGYGGSSYLTGYAGGNGSQTTYTGCTTSISCTFSSNAIATDGVTFGSGGGGGGYNGNSATLGNNSGSTSTAGGAGKGGVVIFSWTIQNGAVSSISFSGSIKKLTPVVITANVNYSGTVNFYTNGRPINHCQGIATTGTSPNITATCNWKPITHGSQYVTATVYSSTGAFTTGSNYTGGVTTKRTTSR